MEAKFFIKGPKKSNQSSNLTSQRMVTESRFMTLLIRTAAQLSWTVFHSSDATYSRNFLASTISTLKWVIGIGFRSHGGITHIT